MSVNLVFPYYNHKDKYVLSQWNKAILWNKNHSSVEKIHIVTDREYSRLNRGDLSGTKIVQHPIDRQPQVDDCFQLVNDGGITDYVILEYGGCYFESDHRCPSKIDLGRPTVFTHHRSGWEYAINSIQGLHNQCGVMFDGFVERNLSWSRAYAIEHDIVPYKVPWVGVMHNPPNMPKCFHYDDSPQEIMKRDIWKQSMEHCKGLFCLSQYHAEWLRRQVEVPVCTLWHPTEIPKTKFNLNHFIRNTKRTLIQVGWWLRRFPSIFQLDEIPYDRAILSHIKSDKLWGYVECEKQTVERDKCQIWDWVLSDAYDKLFVNNIVFLHLYDSSANNALIECIVRHTPVLVNRIPAVMEYLGDDYPFYFNTLDEAAEKCRDFALVEKAHDYLCGLPKYKYDGDYFCRSLVESNIYRSLRG